MYVDLFYACKEAFLITKIVPLGHTMVTALDKADTTSLCRTLRIHLGTYGQQRITITAIYSNNEKGITAMAQDYAGAGITLYQSGPGMHVHVIECAILARRTLSGLPYNCPMFLFRLLVVFVPTCSTRTLLEPMVSHHSNFCTTVHLTPRSTPSSNLAATISALPVILTTP